MRIDASGLITCKRLLTYYNLNIGGPQFKTSCCSHLNFVFEMHFIFMVLCGNSVFSKMQIIYVLQRNCDAILLVFYDNLCHLFIMHLCLFLVTGSYLLRSLPIVRQVHRKSGNRKEMSLEFYDLHLSDKSSKRVIPTST